MLCQKPAAVRWSRSCSSHDDHGCLEYRSPSQPHPTHCWPWLPLPLPLSSIHPWGPHLCFALYCHSACLSHHWHPWSQQNHLCQWHPCLHGLDECNCLGQASMRIKTPFSHGTIIGRDVRDPTTILPHGCAAPATLISSISEDTELREAFTHQGQPHESHNVEGFSYLTPQWKGLTTSLGQSGCPRFKRRQPSLCAKRCHLSLAFWRSWNGLHWRCMRLRTLSGLRRCIHKIVMIM